MDKQLNRLKQKADECALALLSKINREKLVTSDVRTQLRIYDMLTESFSVGYLEAWLTLHTETTPSTRAREEYQNYLLGPLDPRD